MLANLPEKWFASRVLDQFGRPVARSHQRIEPFQHSHARPLWPGEPVAPCTELLQALLIGVHAPARLLRAVNSLADSQDILPDIVQPVRGEGDNARAQAGELRDGAGNITLADRADLALRLRKNDIRTQFLQKIAINGVNAKRAQRCVFRNGLSAQAV